MPELQLRSWPTAGVPAICGATVFTGPPAPPPTVTAAEATSVLPEPFAAVTTQASDDPTSAAATVYVAEVAAAIAAPPRRHWYEYVSPMPVQAPGEQKRFWPTAGEPAIEG